MNLTKTQADKLTFCSYSIECYSSARGIFYVTELSKFGTDKIEITRTSAIPSALSQDSIIDLYDMGLLTLADEQTGKADNNLLPFIHYEGGKVDYATLELLDVLVLPKEPFQSYNVESAPCSDRVFEEFYCIRVLLNNKYYYLCRNYTQVENKYPLWAFIETTRSGVQPYRFYPETPVPSIQELADSPVIKNSFERGISKDEFFNPAHWFIVHSKTVVIIEDVESLQQRNKED